MDDYKKWHTEKVEDIRNNPERHMHSSDELRACCTYDGGVDFSILDAHSKYVDLGSNGGVKCDAIDGPCSCGAWHSRIEKEEYIKNEKIKKEEDKYTRFDILDFE